MGKYEDQKKEQQRVRDNNRQKLMAVEMNRSSYRYPLQNVMAHVEAVGPPQAVKDMLEWEKELGAGWVRTATAKARKALAKGKEDWTAPLIYGTVKHTDLKDKLFDNVALPNVKGPAGVATVLAGKDPSFYLQLQAQVDGGLADNDNDVIDTYGKLPNYFSPSANINKAFTSQLSPQAQQALQQLPVNQAAEAVSRAEQLASETGVTPEEAIQTVGADIQKKMQSAAVQGSDDPVARAMQYNGASPIKSSNEIAAQPVPRGAGIGNMLPVPPAQGLNDGGPVHPSEAWKDVPLGVGNTNVVQGQPYSGSGGQTLTGKLLNIGATAALGAAVPTALDYAFGDSRVNDVFDFAPKAGHSSEVPSEAFEVADDATQQHIKDSWAGYTPAERKVLQDKYGFDYTTEELSFGDALKDDVKNTFGTADAWKGLAGQFLGQEFNEGGNVPNYGEMAPPIVININLGGQDEEDALSHMMDRGVPHDMLRGAIHYADGNLDDEGMYRELMNSGLDDTSSRQMVQDMSNLRSPQGFNWGGMVQHYEAGGGVWGTIKDKLSGLLSSDMQDVPQYSGVPDGSRTTLDTPAGQNYTQMTAQQPIEGYNTPPMHQMPDGTMMEGAMHQEAAEAAIPQLGASNDTGMLPIESAPPKLIEDAASALTLGVTPMSDEGLLGNTSQQQVNVGKYLNRYAGDQIKQFEGFKDKAYQDAGGVWTIGYGRTDNSDGSPIHPLQTTDKATEDAWFNQRYGADKEFVNTYGQLKGYNWSPEQLEALTSFTYNTGRGGLDQLTKGGERSNAEIGQMLVHYNNAGGKDVAGLTNRRLSEQALFTGQPSQVLTEVPELDNVGIQRQALEQRVEDGNPFQRAIRQGKLNEFNTLHPQGAYADVPPVGNVPNQGPVPPLGFKRIPPQDVEKQRAALQQRVDDGNAFQKAVRQGKLNEFNAQYPPAPTQPTQPDILGDVPPLNSVPAPTSPIDTASPVQVSSGGVDSTPKYDKYSTAQPDATRFNTDFQEKPDNLNWQTTEKWKTLTSKQRRAETDSSPNVATIGDKVVKQAPSGYIVASADGSYRPASAKELNDIKLAIAGKQVGSSVVISGDVQKSSWVDDFVNSGKGDAVQGEVAYAENLANVANTIKEGTASITDISDANKHIDNGGATKQDMSAHGTGDPVVDKTIFDTVNNAKTVDGMLNALDNRIKGLKKSYDKSYRKSIVSGLIGYALVYATGGNFQQSMQAAQFGMTVGGGDLAWINQQLATYQTVYNGALTNKFNSVLKREFPETTAGKTDLISKINNADIALASGSISQEQYDAYVNSLTGADADTYAPSNLEKEIDYLKGQLALGKAAGGITQEEYDIAVAEVMSPVQAGISAAIGKENAKGNEAAYNADYGSYTSNQEALANYQILNRLFNNINTGALTGSNLVITTKSVLDQLGLTDFDVSDENKARNVINSLVITERSKLKGSGAISDYEAKQLSSLLPSLTNTRAANRAIIAIRTAEANRENELFDDWTALQVDTISDDPETKKSALRQIGLGYRVWKANEIKQRLPQWEADTKKVVDDTLAWDDAAVHVDAEFQQVLQSNEGSEVTNPETGQVWIYTNNKYIRKS